MSGDRLLSADLMAFAPWPGRARVAARHQSSNDGWGQYIDSIARLLPPHAAQSLYGDPHWRWTTPAGVWNLELIHPNRGPRAGDRVRVWLGTGWDDAPSRWRLDDPTITHVIGFLVVVGALDWERPEEEGTE